MDVGQITIRPFPCFQAKAVCKLVGALKESRWLRGELRDRSGRCELPDTNQICQTSFLESSPSSDWYFSRCIERATYFSCEIQRHLSGLWFEQLLGHLEPFQSLGWVLLHFSNSFSQLGSC
jgi:hypothetical protein